MLTLPSSLSSNWKPILFSPKILWIKKEIVKDVLDLVENFFTLNYLASEIKWIPLKDKEIIAELIYHLSPNKQTAIVDKFSTINLNFWEDLSCLEEDSFQVYSSSYENNNILIPPYTIKNNKPSKSWCSISWLWKYVFTDFISSLKNQRVSYISICASMSARVYYIKLFERLEQERIISAFYVQPDTPWVFEIII